MGDGIRVPRKSVFSALLKWRSGPRGVSRLFSNSGSTVCPLVRGDNPRAGLSPLQVDKPCYKYVIPPPSVYAKLYLMLKFAIFGKGDVNTVFPL